MSIESDSFAKLSADMNEMIGGKKTITPEALEVIEARASALFTKFTGSEEKEFDELASTLKGKVFKNLYSEMTLVQQSQEISGGALAKIENAVKQFKDYLEKSQNADLGEILTDIKERVYT